MTRKFPGDRKAQKSDHNERITTNSGNYADGYLYHRTVFKRKGSLGR